MPIVNTRKPPSQTFAGRLPKTTFEIMGATSDEERRAQGHFMFGGTRPKEMRVEDLLALAHTPDNFDDIEIRYRNRIRSPLTAIRAWCVTQCQCGSVVGVNTCPVTDCPLWAFRMGNNPFFGKIHEASDNTGDE